MYIANTLFRTAQLWPDAPSLAHQKRAFTWAQTLDRVRRAASGLRALAGDRPARIAILALSGIEYFELTFAVPIAGQTLAPMNVRLAVPELEALLTQINPAVLCFDAAHTEQARTLHRALGCAFVFWGEPLACPDFAVSYEALIAAHSPAEPAEVDPEESWGILFTGGTTGLPKGVQLSHRAIAFNLHCILQDLRWGEGCRFLHVSPLFHLSGIGPSYAVTALGGSHRFLPAFSVEGLLQALSQHRCTCTNLVPTMINWLMARDDIDRFDLSELRHLAYGASAINLPTLRRLVAKLPGVSLSQFYGQTEACGGLTMLRDIDHSLDEALAHRLASAGRAVRGARVVVLDPDGNEAPRGTWGEICGRSDGLFCGYFGHPEQTAEAMRGGWLHTGDIGYMDEDGFVYVTDRLKDMIVTGGENVSSSEVENVIAAHPEVLQVAVLAAPDESWGERVHACVVTRLDSTLTVPSLIAFCRERIAGYKCPKSVTLQTEPLPLSALGKVRKDLLRAGLVAVADALPDPLPVPHAS